jgi:uncharacterized damage-inducible protein DinB
MKDYFLKLFQYDKYANLQILQAIFDANQPQEAVKLMAHLLAAQQIWLSRCTGMPASGISLIPDWQPVQFKYIIEKNNDLWMQYLNGVNTDDFNLPINYLTLKGESLQNNLADIITQVTNHGTHHRAQIGQQLKLAGLNVLPPTDYIFFMREQNQ